MLFAQSAQLTHFFAQFYCTFVKFITINHFLKSDNQTNTYFCYELLWAMCFQIRHMKKYLKKEFKMADVRVFLR